MARSAPGPARLRVAAGDTTGRRGRLRRPARLAGAALRLALTVLVARTLTRSILRWERPAVPPEDLAGAASTFLPVRGLELHIVDSARGASPETAGVGGPPQPGEATPLLLLHGFASGAFSWRSVTPSLSAERRVIAYDRPGAGLSARPLSGEWNPEDWAGGSPYTAEAQADLAVALLDRLDVRRAVLVGNSAGGTVALLAALRHPARVSGLILVSPAVGPHSARLNRLLPVLAATGLAPWTARLAARFAPGLLARARHPQHPPPEPLIRAYRSQTLTPHWDTVLTEVAAAAPLPSLQERLGSLRVHSLWLAGAADRLVPPAETAHAARLAPGGRFAEMAGAGHMPQEECPAEFAKIILAFLAELPRASDPAAR